MTEPPPEMLASNVPPVGFEIALRTAHGAPGTLTILGHPAVAAITVSRDLGDARSGAATLRGVPCLLLDFVSIDAASAAAERLRAISSRFTHLETPTRIASSNGVPFTLRLMHGFDEATIAAIAACHVEACERYDAAQAAQHTRPRPGRR